jgi:hypothetical protein
VADERQREQLGPTPEVEERPNPGGDPKVFLRLVTDVRSASDEDRAQLVGQLIDVLVAMRAPGNERAEAKAVLGQLDLRSLTGLVDARGRSARAEAVQTVLTLGFPYALEVSPQDLEYAREKERDEEKSTVSAEGVRRLDRARRIASWLGGASAAIQLMVLGATGVSNVEATAITAATMTLTAGWALWMRSRVGRMQRDLVQGAAGMATALATGLTVGHGHVSAGVAVTAALPLFGAIAALSASRGADQQHDP